MERSKITLIVFGSAFVSNYLVHLLWNYLAVTPSEFNAGKAALVAAFAAVIVTLVLTSKKQTEE